MKESVLLKAGIPVPVNFSGEAILESNMLKFL